MKIRCDCKSCLVLIVVFAGAKIGLGQDAPATAAIKILETASHLATEGRLKDALRIVNFVQTTPGLTDREAAECQLLLAEFEALAIKFYASNRLGQQPSERRIETKVGAVRSGAITVALGNEPDVNVLGVAVANVEPSVEALVEADRSKVRPFEWVAVNEDKSRSADRGEGRVTESPSTAEVPRVLPPSPGLRTVFDEAGSVQHPPRLVTDEMLLLRDQQISAQAEKEHVRAGSDPIPTAPRHADVSADLGFGVSSVEGTQHGQSRIVSRDSMFNYKWVLLIAGVVLGLLPAVVVRIAGGVRERFRSGPSGGDYTEEAPPDGISSSVAKVDSIFSQIVQENQRIQR